MTSLSELLSKSNSSKKKQKFFEDQELNSNVTPANVWESMEPFFPILEAQFMRPKTAL